MVTNESPRTGARSPPGHPRQTARGIPTVRTVRDLYDQIVLGGARDRRWTSYFMEHFFRL